MQVKYVQKKMAIMKMRNQKVLVQPPTQYPPLTYESQKVRKESKGDRKRKI